MSKVLVVEDDEDVMDVLEAYLRQRGHQTIKFDSARAALESISEGKTRADLILCDLRLPEMTGLEFLVELRRTGSSVPFIIMTSNSKLETAMEAIEAGAFDFVIKPLKVQQVGISIERALRFSKLRAENESLKNILSGNGTQIEGIVGKSRVFQEVLDLARRVSKGTANVLINGESGTGKEVVARAIHDLGTRAKKPFVAINCSAIPENLLETELFGHARGAFTGAHEKKQGLFEDAQGGTLFLDEIGDMNLQLQAKLLRVVQERKIKRIGENQYRPIDVRIISATHKDLRKEVREGNFREDLFFRLNVVPIRIPPLRERVEDIMPLADYFLKKFAVLNNSPANTFSADAKEFLISSAWPGNVRELEHAIEREVVLATTDEIRREHLSPFSYEEVPSRAHQPVDTSGDFLQTIDRGGETMTLDRLINNYIKIILERNGGVKERTARELGIDRKTLYRRIRDIYGTGLEKNEH